MIKLAPLLRIVSRQESHVIVSSRCSPIAGFTASAGIRFASSQTPFRCTPNLLQRQLPPRPPPSTPSRKPEDLFPESFPLKEEDLVNPSGRIYDVRRPPGDEVAHQEQSQPAPDFNQEALRYAVPLSEARTPSFFRPILFLGFSGVIFYYTAAKLSLDQTRETADQVIESNKGGIFGDFSSFFGKSGNGEGSKDPRRHERISENQMRAVNKQELAERLGRKLNRLMGWCDQIGLPAEGKKFIGRMYTWGAEGYLNLPESKLILVPIIAVNTVIFLGWRVSMLPSLRYSFEQFMKRHFLHAPASGRSYTLLTSTFSHMGPLHFLLNNAVLWSFGASALMIHSFHAGEDGKGKHTPESSLGPHFWAFFATAGVFSGLVAHLLTAASFRMLATGRGLQFARTNIGRIGSLGASGAVYSVVVMSALAIPQSRIG